jgi:hypothetical protein
VLEKIYSPRFSNIFFLVPFYDGDNPRVIPVYESSYYFQSFFAQGFHRFFKEEFTHYIFTGDDCILNPSVNENNFLEQTGLPAGSDMIPEFIQFHNLKNGGWWHTKKAIDFFNNRGGAEIKNELPSKDEALKRFTHHGLEMKALTARNIFGPGKISFLNWWKSILYKQFYLRVKWKNYRKNGKIELPYPAVGSYSDMFVITDNSIREFCRYCGILAATGLFVEIAIPTALVLVSKKITLEKELKLNGKALWSRTEVEEVENSNQKSLTSLLNNFPVSQLYFHPVKLSKWKNDL